MHELGHAKKRETRRAVYLVYTAHGLPPKTCFPVFYDTATKTNKYHTWYSSNNNSSVPGGHGFPIYQYQVVPGNRHLTSVRDGKSYTLLSTSYTDYLDRVTFAVRLHAPWDVCIGEPISSHLETCGTHTQRTCRFRKIWPRSFHRYVARRLLCTRCRENELQIRTRYEGVRCGAYLACYQYTSIRYLCAT